MSSNQDHGGLVERDEALEEAARLPADVLAMCKRRGWSLHWTARGAYLHLESSELIEALRGKHGDPLKEAGDVLLVLMSITENAGLRWPDVLAKARSICDDLMTKPHYKGEEYDQALKGGSTVRQTDRGHSASTVASGKPDQESVAPRSISVPMPLFLFLLGSGEVDGIGFGEKHPTIKGRYWWRRKLQECIPIDPKRRGHETTTD